MADELPSGVDGDTGHPDLDRRDRLTSGLLALGVVGGLLIAIVVTVWAWDWRWIPTGLGFALAMIVVTAFVQGRTNRRRRERDGTDSP